MMYNQKFVVCVKNQGQVLREDGEKVYIPFGSEFSILLKNLNSVRALASIEVDGKSVTDGIDLIVPANGDVELERYITNGNLSIGNRFKFIERTSSIEQNRGVKIEDGIVRVEFRFEKIRTPNIFLAQSNIYGMSSNSLPRSESFSKGVTRGMPDVNVTYDSAPGAEIQCNAIMGAAQSEVGITVPGSISEQKFQHGAWFETEYQSHVIVLHLVGDIGQKPIEQPVYVSSKQKCVTCGRMNKSGAKFCQECGTSLQIV